MKNKFIRSKRRKFVLAQFYPHLPGSRKGGRGYQRRHMRRDANEKFLNDPDRFTV